MEPQLLTHDQFEIMWEAKNQWIVLFTSSTCGPCKRIDKSAIAEAAGIPFFICDTKMNRTTTAYCNITRVPTLALMQPQKVISTLSGVSDTEKIIEWIEKNKRQIGKPKAERITADEKESAIAKELIFTFIEQHCPTNSVDYERNNHSI